MPVLAPASKGAAGLAAMALLVLACGSNADPPAPGAAAGASGGMSVTGPGAGGGGASLDAGDRPPSDSSAGGSSPSNDAATAPTDGGAETRDGAGLLDAGSGEGSTASDGGGPAIPTPPPPGSLTQRPRQGPVALKTEDELRAFCAAYDGVTGSLTISSGTLKNLDALNCLVEVTGRFDVTASALESAVLPNLRAVGAMSLGTARALAKIELPLLEFSRGEVRIYGSDALAVLALPTLRYVGDNLVITGNTKLAEFSAPRIVHAGNDVQIEGSQLARVTLTDLVEAGHNLVITSLALAAIELRHVRRVGNNFWWTGGASYASVDLSELETVGFSLALDGNDKNDDLVVLRLPRLVSAPFLSVQSHPQLKEIDVPLLASSSLTLGFNPALERIGLPSLVDSTQILMSSLPKLSSLDMSSLGKVNGLFDLRVGALLDVDLPKLTVARDLQTSGLRSFSAPLLPSISSGTFNGAADGFRLALPALSKATQLVVGSGATELSIPVLESADTVIIGTTALTRLDLPALGHALRIDVGNNPKLETVSFPNVVELDQTTVSGNPALQSLAYGHLTFCKRLSLGDLPVLRSLSVPALTRVQDLLEVRRTGLVDLASFSGVTYTASLLVQNNAGLKSLLMPNLAADSLSLTVDGNGVLEAIDLRQVTLAAYFKVSKNASLTRLAGFDALATVYAFFVLDNPALEDLTGLRGIRKVMSNFYITGNVALPKSEVDGLVQAIGRTNITGEFVVQ